MIQHHDYVTAVRRESQAFAAAAEGNFRSPVVACPGWDVAELVWHLREVQWFWATIVAGPLGEPPEEKTQPDRPDDPGQLLADFRAGADVLADTLAAADPAADCWTWAPQKDVAWVIRHQAQEAAVHRFDAELAAGRPSPVEPRLAADALEEFLTFSTAYVVEGTDPLPGPVRLEATDGGGAWTVREDEDRRLQLVGLGHGGPGDGHATDAVTTVRGTASDLLLGLYRRVGPDRLSIEGDAAGWPSLVARNDLD